MIIRTVVLLWMLVVSLPGLLAAKVSCADNGSILVQTNLKDVFFRVRNDVWGDAHSRHEQCIFGGQGGAGWRWLKPSFSYQPYFPNLFLNLSESLPITVSELHRFQVTFSAVVRGTGTYDLAFDIWFSTDSGGKHATDEVMVFLQWTNRTVKLPTAVNDGFNNYGYITFNVGWRFHAFFLLSNKIPFEVDLAKLFSHARVNGYVRDIALGNELFSGTGEMVIYAINFQINDLSVRNAGGCYQLSCSTSSLLTNDGRIEGWDHLLSRRWLWRENGCQCVPLL